MKKGLVILFVSLTICTIRLKAQSNTDTLAILQTIINNKANYIGQPFSGLLSKLALQIKYFFPSAGMAYNRYAETSTTFSFYFPTNPDMLNKTYPRIRIYWQTKQNRSQSLTLYNQAKGAWSPSLVSHYGSAIISDIELVTGGTNAY